MKRLFLITLVCSAIGCIYTYQREPTLEDRLEKIYFYAMQEYPHDIYRQRLVAHHIITEMNLWPEIESKKKRLGEP